MRWLLVFALLAVQDQPQPGHGPYANQAGVKCYRGETRDLPPNSAGMKRLVKCDCKLICNDHGTQVEAGDCQTFCGPKNDRGEGTQCLCHVDEACPPEKGTK